MREHATTVAVVLIAAALLAGCETIANPFAESEPVAPATANTVPATQAPAAALPQPVAQPAPVARPDPLVAPPVAPPVPHIYLAFQSDGEGSPVSAIFAIDAARNNTPSDDPAVRLSPENGLCNPHEMRNFTFPPQYAARPVVSEIEQAQGLTAANLPAFMAVSVTEAMLALGLASDREETRILNICTRKLWEELVLAENQAARPAGQ